MKIDKYCLQCGDTLPDYAPINKQYCSDACKQNAYRDRLAEPDETDEETDFEEESGIHPLAWIGMLGLGAWLLNSTAKTPEKAVTKRAALPVPPSLDNL